MANTYYTLLTQAGQASIANAIALGQQVTLTHMAVGDGNGVPTVPKETQTELVNEVYRAAINQLLTDPDNPNYLIAEMIVPTNVGGWSVREVGLFDESGDLLAIANFPETYKPKLEEGSGRDLIIRIILQVQSTDAITLKIDPTIVLASQAWVKENFTRAILLPGGTTGQFLAKKSDANGDTEWKDISVMTGATAEAPGKQGLVPQPQVGDRNRFLRGDGCWATAFRFYRIVLAESDWTQESATGRYTKTITKTTTADTCIAVHDSTGNRILVNITDNDTKITLTAIAPVAGYAVISGPGGE